MEVLFFVTQTKDVEMYVDAFLKVSSSSDGKLGHLGPLGIACALASSLRVESMLIKTLAKVWLALKQYFCQFDANFKQ